MLAGMEHIDGLKKGDPKSGAPKDGVPQTIVWMRIAGDSQDGESDHH